MAQIETGSSTAGKANVDSAFNLNVTLPITAASGGFAALASEYDTGASTGTRKTRAISSTLSNRLAVSKFVILFQDTFGVAAQNSAQWTQVNTTMTQAVSGGYLQLNSGSSVTTTQDAESKTVQKFNLPLDGTLFFEAQAYLLQTPQTNNEVILGFAALTASAVASDGAYFIWGTDGSFKTQINNGAALATSAALTAPTSATKHKFRVEVTNDRAHFYVDDVFVSELITSAISNTATRPFTSEGIPFTVRVRNTGAVGTAQQLRVADVIVGWRDTPVVLDGSVAIAYGGGMGYQGQSGGTMGSTANYVNSTNPAAAVPTNTTAALAAGLGGQFWETDTLAVTTDGIVQSYQNPVFATNTHNKTLVITGVTIDSFVQTALTGGGYTASWSLAFGHSAVSLATAETLGTSKGARRVALGFQTVPSGAAINTALNTVTQRFNAPIVVQPGEFIQTVKKKIGTAPTAGVVAHLITFDCHWI